MFHSSSYRRRRVRSDFARALRVVGWTHFGVEPNHSFVFAVNAKYTRGVHPFPTQIWQTMVIHSQNRPNAFGRVPDHYSNGLEVRML